MANERRTNNRSKFAYYMRVLDNITSELVGYLTDISPRGFKLDSSKPMIPNKDYTLRMDLTPDISDRSFIIFIARAKWTKNDPTDPNSFLDGFKIVNISPHDEDIFNRILAKYVVQETRR